MGGAMFTVTASSLEELQKKVAKAIEDAHKNGLTVIRKSTEAEWDEAEKVFSQSFWMHS
jgi:predicted small metal-binding protein